MLPGLATLAGLVMLPGLAMLARPSVPAGLSMLADPAALAAGAPASTDELAGKPPVLSAPAHTPFGWSSKQGLRFVWWMPPDAGSKPPRAITVILHGRGFDYRWGWKNHSPDTFRPEDIVLSVDGTSPDGEHRWFASEKADADAFQAFLFEMTRLLSVERVFLYGHVEGGAFALYFAGEHPESVAGVVAHDAPTIAPPKARAEAAKLPIVLLHGTLDPDAFFAQAIDARAAWVKAGFQLVHLRRLDRASYEPNPRRACDALGWCDAMSTADPGTALATASDLLQVDKASAARAPTPVDFSGAREILRRFEGRGSAPFPTPDADSAAKAKAWTDAIEAAGAAHVRVLKKTIAKKKDLKLDRKLPIGHLAALREDFRGVDSVEAYAKELGYDELFDSQRKPAAAIVDAWRRSKDAKATFEIVVDNLTKAWLYEGFPPDMLEKLRAWKSDEKKLGLAPKVLKSWPQVEEWQRAWEGGLDEYASVWKEWKGL